MGYKSQPKWAEDLWYAVELAVSEAVSPERFREEVADCWEEALRRRMESEPRIFLKG